MSQDTVYKTKKMSQKDLEKHFGVKLTIEEFNVVKKFACEDNDVMVGDDYRFHPYDQYLLSIKQWGTKTGNVRKKPKYIWQHDLFDSVGGGSFRFETASTLLTYRNANLKEIYISIQDEIDNQYPKLEIKRETVRVHNKQILKENKNYSTSGGPDPDFIIGLVVFVFLTWLIFGVILGGGDLSPGAPSFFGHDGG